MKNKLYKIIIKIHICIIMLAFLSGCWNAREINDLEIVIGMGVDKGKTPDTVNVLAQIVKPGEIRQPSSDGGGGGSTVKPYWNAINTGNTVFDAVRNMTHKTGKRLFVSHSQVVIFGKELVQEGIQEHFDFFLRAHEMRPNTLILISNNTAEEILSAKLGKGQLPSMNILKINKSFGFTSEFNEVNFQDFSSKMLSNTTAPTAPMIRLVDENKELYISEMAVFKRGKMVGKLTQKESRGLLWVTNKVKSGIIIIDAPKGEGKAVIEIMKSKTKVKPELKDNKIIINIEVVEDSSMAEQTSKENLATVEAFAQMEKSIEEAIKKEIVAGFEKSKGLNADIFGFGEMIHKKYKKQWEEMELKWNDLYPTIQLNINVKAKLRKTDLLTRPAVPEKEIK